MLEIMRKTQYCCLEMLLLRNKVEKCDFLRFFLSQATASKAICGGLRARHSFSPTAKLSFLNSKTVSEL